ncbi:MAG: TPM domain-containing protein [Verrucomicrobiota bacterium]
MLLFVHCPLAAEVIPPTPDRYFNDYAKVVSAGTAETLNRRLEDFEKETSSQIVVAIFPKMRSESSLEDYTHRIYAVWKVGQKKKNNGAVLFVFVQDRKMRIENNYGLEGSLPDATCKRIIEDEIKPHFQRGDYDGGLVAGVNAVLAATKGEYKGSGRTVREQGGAPQAGSHSMSRPFIPFIIFILLIIVLRSFGRRGVSYGGSRRSYLGGFPMGGWSGSSGSSGWSGGGGGGFSSGGGSGGGGGGASGSW